jgi:folylpolyglutamate synthase/dihydropteroate synthase
MADKDVAGLLTALAGSPRLSGARVVCTAAGAGRALAPAALAETWRAIVGGRPVTAPDPEAALETALGRGDGPVIVAGSLYLVGAVRALLVDDPELRDPPEAP